MTFLTPTPGFKNHLLTNPKLVTLMDFLFFTTQKRVVSFANIFNPNPSVFLYRMYTKPCLFMKGKVITGFRWGWVCCVGLMFVFGHLPARALPSHRGICGLSECHNLMKTDMTVGWSHASTWIHTHSCHRFCFLNLVSKGSEQQFLVISLDILPIWPIYVCLVLSVCYTVLVCFVCVCMFICTCIMR